MVAAEAVRKGYQGGWKGISAVVHGWLAGRCSSGTGRAVQQRDRVPPRR